MPEQLKWKKFCVLGGVLEEEWDYFFHIIDCGPILSCEPTMIGKLPTIEKYFLRPTSNRYQKVLKVS